MAPRQTMFFATEADLAPVLATLEAKERLQYTLAGMFALDAPHTYTTYADIPDFGQTVHPDAVANPRYLLSVQGTEIQTERVPQRAGGVRFALDQLHNPDTVVIRPGGRFGEEVLLYGSVGTGTQSAASKALYAFAAKALRKSFTRQEEFLVGPEAGKLWNAGVRLTIGALSPPEFDLRRTGQ